MGKTKNKPVIMIDFGGVYFTHANHAVGKRFSKELGIPKEEIIKAMMGTNWNEHASGKCSELKYWKNVSKSLKISPKQAIEIKKMLYSYPEPKKDTAKLVKKLKKNYRIAVISSHIPGWIKALENKYKMSKEFHEMHYSYDHGIDKPSAELFKRAVKKMSVKPHDCIVIDDYKEFLDAVKKTGAKTILFKNAKQAEKQLRKMGVEV